MKKRYTLVFLATLLFTAPCAVFAQQTIIKGRVLDATDKTPAGFANVALLSKDSALISGVTTSQDGYFEINNASEDNHISISYVGYDTENLPVTTFDDVVKEILLRPSAISLGEVTIKARSVIIKDDRKVILPSEQQIKMSADGTEVLRKMQLPRIMVDPVSGEISMSGNGQVQLRINGVQATHSDIASIPPADILRIEYYDSPGARYGNTDAVIDYITRRNTTGGNINGVFFNGGAKKRKSLDNRLSLKYNYGKSEFSANAILVQRKQDWTRDYDEKLIFPDNEIHRIEAGKSTPFNKKVFGTTFNYSFMEKDSYFFNAQLRYSRNDFPNSYEDRKSELYTTGSTMPLLVTDHTVEKGNSPALDLYFQRQFNNNQSLIFNVVATYIDTDSRRRYQEKAAEGIKTDILSNIKGDKYSLIAEGVYEKRIGQNKITGGAKHLQAYTHNKYTGSTAADVSLRQAESSVYAEYQGKTGRLGYMANVTGTRVYFSQGDTHKESFALQPAARITFEPLKDMYLRYTINLHNNVPSLAAMNNVEQEIDSWQVRRGNPHLNAFNTLSQKFATGYSKNMWGADITIGYDHEYKPVMESVFYENGKFIHNYENQRSFQNISLEASFVFKPWKDHISLSVVPILNRFISRGNNYLHTYTMSEVRVNLDLSYHNWLANFTTITPPRFMYGEQLMKSDQMYTIMAGYKRPQWSVMAGVLNPFSGEYKTDNRNWSAVNPVISQIHTTNNRSFLVRLSMNLNYGKQLKSIRKQINNIDTDPGIIQGVKN